MDVSTGTIIALASLALAVVVMAVRGEFRSNANADEIEDLYARIEKHVGDSTIHHPDDELDRRFKTLENSIGRIEKGIEKLDARLDYFFKAK